MRKLLAVVLLTVSTASFGACNIELAIKKEGAKTAYAGDASVSKKVQAGLESIGCTVTKRVMTKEQVKEMTIKALEKRLEKLRK